MLQAAQPAQLQLDGIATVIERDSNEIDDLIDNVTLDLYKEDTANGTIVKLEIENDLSAAKDQAKRSENKERLLLELVAKQDEILKRLDRLEQQNQQKREP